MSKLDDLYLLSEISEKYDIPDKTLQRNFKEGKIEGIKLGNRIYLVQSSVEKWAKHSYHPQYKRRMANKDEQDFLEMFYTPEEALTLIFDILNKTRKN